MMAAIPLQNKFHCCKWKSSEFCMSLQAGCYCSPPNLYMSNELIMSCQDHRGHVGGCWESKEDIGADVFIPLY